MDKKFLGIRLGTYLFALLSVICAVLFWLFAKSVNSEPSEPAAGYAFLGLLGWLL